MSWMAMIYTHSLSCRIHSLAHHSFQSCSLLGDLSSELYVNTVRASERVGQDERRCALITRFTVQGESDTHGCHIRLFDYVNRLDVRISNKNASKYSHEGKSHSVNKQQLSAVSTFYILFMYSTAVMLFIVCWEDVFYLKVNLISEKEEAARAQTKRTIR